MEENPRSFAYVLDIAATLDTDTYKALSEIYVSLHRRENVGLFRSLQRIWEFLTYQEKEILVASINSHLQEEVDNVLILEFFSKLLKSFQEDVIYFINEVLSSEAFVFDSLLEISRHLRGDDVLSDMRSFFSRSHIIRILDLLSGQNTDRANDNKEENSPAPSTKLNADNFVIERKSDDFIRCITKLNQLENDFYRIYREGIHNLCPGINFGETGLFLDWFSQADTLLAPLRDEFRSIDRQGLFSPYFGRTTLINFHASGSALEQRNLQWRDVIALLYNGLYGTPWGDFIKALLEGTISLLEGNDGLLFRQRLYRLLSHDTALKQDIEDIAQTLPRIIKDWNEFRQNNDPLSYGSQPPNFQCQNYHNQNIGNEPCPPSTDFLDALEESLTIIKENPTMLRSLLSGLSVDYGIPIRSREETKINYRLTLQAGAEILYAATDRTKEINRKPIPYINAGFEESPEPTTIMERVEGLIREAEIHGNEKALSALSRIYHSPRYTTVIEQIEWSFSVCTRLGFACGTGWMNNNEHRMAKNALRFFPSLIDLQEYDEYVRAILTALLSPPSRAQGARILTHAASFSLLSNIARTVQDRLGRNPQAYEAFLRSQDLRLLSQEFLKNTDISLLEEKASSMIHGSLAVRNNNNQNFLKVVASAIESADYGSLRLIEDALMNVLIVRPLHRTDESKRAKYVRRQLIGHTFIHC